MIIAKQSTARTVTIGPILDSNGAAVTNGVVADLKISKNGGDPAALNGSATLTHRNTGHYSLALTASDLDTVGSASVVIDDSTNAMAIVRFTVIEEAVYDALFGASAPGYVANAPVNVAQLNGTSTAGTGSRVADAFVAMLNIATPTFTVASTNQTGDSFARIGAPVNASISADVAAVKTDTGNLVTRITSTLFSGITSLAQWLGMISGKQVGNSTARTEMRATGAGSGTFDETTDSLEAVADADAGGGEIDPEAIAIAVWNTVIEPDIPASDDLIDDGEEQQTGLTAGQALALKASTDYGLYSGAEDGELIFCAFGKPDVVRIRGRATLDGRSLITYVVPPVLS